MVQKDRDGGSYFKGGGHVEGRRPENRGTEGAKGGRVRGRGVPLPAWEEAGELPLPRKFRIFPSPNGVLWR